MVKIKTKTTNYKTKIIKLLFKMKKRKKLKEIFK
jgi:hypothetical protein